MAPIVLKAASLLLFIILGIYANGRVIYTVLVADDLRPVLNLFVASLSMADLAICTIIMPLTFISLISGEWLLSHISCKIHGMLLVYLAHVEAFSSSTIVYERYRAIYRKRFPSLSQGQVTVLLCMVWLLPMLFVAPMVSQDLVYMKLSGICLNSYEYQNLSASAVMVTEIVITFIGFFFILFSIWKVLAYVLPIRRRVSPGLLSNEEKLTGAAHTRSVWTMLIFMLTYLILVLPLHIARLVSERRKLSGRSAIAEDVQCAFLWMYWLQCVVKPLVYAARSERFSCHCCLPTKRNSAISRFLWRRNRARVYAVADGSLEKSSSTVTRGRSTNPSPGEFLELRDIPINKPTDLPAFRDLRQRIQDGFPSTEGTVEHSMIIIEDLDMKSYNDQSKEKTNCCQKEPYEVNHGGLNVIPIDGCYDAEELENIEQFFDEAINIQQQKWDAKYPRNE